MKMLEIESMLKDLRKARERWGQGRTEFFSGYDWVLTRLVHEAAINYMGANQIATALGVSPKTIRAKMRAIGLDPKGGKRALNAKASQALLENAAIMSVDPSEVDLTSPLAYLPMGEELRKQYQDRTLARVTELEDETVSRNDLLLLGAVFARFIGSENRYVDTTTDTGRLILDGSLWDLTEAEAEVITRCRA